MEKHITRAMAGYNVTNKILHSDFCLAAVLELTCLQI